MNALVRHLSVGVFALLIGATWLAAQQPVDGTGTATFLVLISGTRVGTETASLAHSGSGWLLSSTGRLQTPFDLVINKFEVLYGADWQPERLTIDGQLKGLPLLLATSFGLTTALSEMTQGLQHGSSTQQVSPRAVVLPSNIFSAYEALAARIGPMTVGTRLPLYIAPTGETSATLNDISSKRISVGDKTLDIRVFRLTVAGTTGAVPVELWVDARGRMARLSLPAASTVVIRDDLATVMAREEPMRNTGDEDVFIGANGFTLGATVTRAATSAARAPAVVLVSGPGPQDRDHTVFGVSIFGQIAGALANAGQVVVRYDVRGVGRSGGRTESARLNEYSEDAINVVRWLRRRKGVDPKRIVLVGYGDAGPIALVAASLESSIAGVALIGAPSGTGREITLEQQQHLLAQLTLAPSEKSGRLALQTRVMDAVTSGKGWDVLPPDLREQADTAWFRTWLQFDPSAVFRKIDQPVLIIHGSLDAEVPVTDADRLETLARARRKAAPAATQKVVIAGLNHLLVSAKSGSIDEYPSLETQTISPAVTTALSAWVNRLK